MRLARTAQSVGGRDAGTRRERKFGSSSYEYDAHFRMQEWGAGGKGGEVTVQGRTWNLKSGISEFGILAPSKFHDVEIPRFQQKSWNREFEAHTRNFGIWNPSSLLLANSKLLLANCRYPDTFANSQIPNSNPGSKRPPRPRGLGFRESEG